MGPFKPADPIEIDCIEVTNIRDLKTGMLLDDLPLMPYEPQNAAKELVEERQIQCEQGDNAMTVISEEIQEMMERIDKGEMKIVEAIVKVVIPAGDELDYAKDMIANGVHMTNEFDSEYMVLSITLDDVELEGK